VDSDAEQQLQWLVDRTRIRELTARYNQCFDEGDAKGFAATFVADGVMEVAGGPRVEGTEALAAMCRANTAPIRHVTVDPVIEVDGDRAVQYVTLLVVRRATDGGHPSTLQRSGRYEDHLVRTPDGWRFVRRTCTLDGGV